MARDSAGVAIVENTSPMRPVAFEIDSIPLADIGGLNAPNAEFPGPVSSAFRGPHGSIVVVAWTATRIAVFDSTGTWLRDIGQQGSGPGEFEGLGWAYPALGDTIVSFEPMNRRLQVFTPEGAFVRLVTLRAPANFEYPTVQGVSSAGLVATARRYQPSPDDYSLASIGGALFAFAMDGARSDSLLELPRTERIWVRGGTWSRPFDAGNVVRVAGDHIFVANTGRLSVDVYDGRGRLTRVVRIAERARTLAAGEYQRAVDSTLDGLRNPSQREAMRKAFGNAPRNEVAPAFNGLAADRDGGFWLWRTAATRLVSVFDSAGRWSGDAILPEGFRPLETGAGWVLGTWSDADGIVRVRLHRVRPVADGGR
ncbi:MAG: NHL repeat-containing protein [Gemmatimonadales bacterium]